MQLVQAFDVLFSQEIIDAAQVLAHQSTTELVDLVHQSVQKFTVVADQNYRAVKRMYGLFQYILGSHVQVIGRLVQYKEVYRLQQQFDHCKSASLTATQHFYFLVRGFAAKHKGAEDVANLQPYIATGHAVDCIEHGQVAVEQLCLVLGIVAYLHIVPELQVARVGDFAHDALHQGGLALAVLSHKGYFFAAPDGQRHVVEDAMRAIILAHIFANHRIVTAARTGWEFQVQRSVVNLVHLNGDHLFQLLDTALYLHCFRGLVAKAFDEVADVGHLLLLVFVGP